MAGGGRRLAPPFYDVSTLLAWPRVVQYFAQNIAGTTRKPGDAEARHWDAIAEAVDYRPADVCKRVRKLVDACIANRATVTEAVAALPGSRGGYAEETAGLVEENALQIAGRLGKAQ